MTFEGENYRSYLRSVFSDRASRNSQYSMRAFASSIGLSHSSLSLVFQGKRNISVERCEEIAQKLKLENNERERFCLLVEIDQVKNKDRRERILKRLIEIAPEHSKNHQVQLDLFKTISEWYHMVILAYLRLPTRLQSASLIAREIGITSAEVESALDRLERLGLIVKNTQNQWQRTQARLLVNSDSNANADTKKFLIQMLQRAERAIQEQDHSSRITDSETFVISKSKIPELNQLTEEYLRRVVDLAANETKPDAVFHCQVNLFQVSGLERKK